MKAAFPVASSFIAYLAGISVFAMLFKKARVQFEKSKYVLASSLLLLGLFVGLWATFNNSEKATAYVLADPQESNKPIGEGKGIFPGRVVWVHNPAATNENCKNTVNDYWSDTKNTNQAVVDSMVSSSLMGLSGATSDSLAWDLIFRHFNKQQGKGDVGYTAGQKIAIKINLNGQNGFPAEQNINTSPQLCYSILNQLVNVVGVKQSDISIGDPSNLFKDKSYNYVMAKFPSVAYFKTKPTQTTSKVLTYSDGTKAGEYLPQAYINATYMINLPVFKKHHRAGISLGSKNHVGSISPYSKENYQNAHWHKSLPSPDATGSAEGSKYGMYRFFVDVIGHKDLGAKTILHLIDGLWSSTNYAHPPIKWRMEPFNNDYPNSLFASMDPVAIESVCFDFLYQEFDDNHPTEGMKFMSGDKGPFPRFAATDDYLHQAADKANWPIGIKYDPEADGTELPASMGTHEHWNNAKDKQYSRNLSTDGKGIHLYSPNKVSTFLLKESLVNGKVVNYPNPFKEFTTLKFDLIEDSDVSLDIYSIDGRKQYSANLGKLKAGMQQYKLDVGNLNVQLKPGTCFYTLNIKSNKGETSCSGRMMLEK